MIRIKACDLQLIDLKRHPVWTWCPELDQPEDSLAPIELTEEALADGTKLFKCTSNSVVEFDSIALEFHGCLCQGHHGSRSRDLGGCIRSRVRCDIANRLCR